MAARHVGESRFAGIGRLGALLLPSALGVLGTMFLLSVLRPAAAVSAPEGDGALTRPLGPTPVYISKTVDPSHPDTGGLVTICFVIERPGLDVVLLQDVSGSMNDPAGADVTQTSRLAASQVAARALVDTLQGTDRAAVVAYSTAARLAQALTTTRSSVLEAIDGLTAVGWTNVGAGISLSHKALIAAPPPPETVKAIVLLSDGNANCDEGGRCGGDRVTAAARYALERAAGAAADDIRIHTVGFGAGEAVNSELLETIAITTGGEYYFAPDADVLEAVYVTIALRLHDLVIADVLTAGVEAGGAATVTFPIDDDSLISNPLTLCFTATVNLDPQYEGPINDPDSHFCYENCDGQIVCEEFDNPQVVVRGRKIAGDVFCDVNADGQRDGGEAGVPGVIVRTSTGASATTSVTGSYVLRVSSEPAMSVTIEIPSGHIPTTPISEHISSTTGIYTVDFGIRGVVCVQGKVFYDTNANGQDDGEEGLAEATIIASGGPPTVTGSSGTFSLCVPVSGDPITVTETDPEGHTSTAAIAGAGVRVVDSNTLCIDEPEAGRVYRGNKFGDVRWLVYFPVVMRGYAPPSLHLSAKAVDRWKAYAGETLRYTITLTNSGTTEPISAVVTDPIPVDCTYVPGSVTGGGRFEDGQIRWGPGTLGPKAKHSIAFDVEIDDDVCDTTITNTATVMEIWDSHTNLLPPLVITTRIPVINGGFEEGWTGWEHGGELSQTIALTYHSGSFAALLGSPDYPCRDVPVGRAWVSQTVRVPSTVSPALSFWYRIWTYDMNPGLSNSYDLFSVTINGVQAFKDMTTTKPYGCQDPVRDLGWREKTIALSVYRGSYITICFESSNGPDPYYNTWTYLDDVRVVR